MAVVVIDSRRVVFGIFAGEAPGVGRGKSAAQGDHRTERRVFVVRGERAVGGDDVGDVLVAVVSVEIGDW